MLIFAILLMLFGISLLSLAIYKKQKKTKEKDRLHQQSKLEKAEQLINEYEKEEFDKLPERQTKI